jgi:hypothetical protein
MEFTRLYEAMVSLPVLAQCVCLFIINPLCFQYHEPLDSSDHQRSAMELSVAMGNLTVVLKGEEDLITDGNKG